MNDISCVALFCEDIREEKAGSTTLVGIMPDNVNLPGIPGTMLKLAVYLRMYMRPDFVPGQIITRIVMPDGSELAREEATAEVIEQSFRKATEAQNPYAGLIAKLLLIQVAIPQPGRMQVIVTAAGEDHVAGMINLRRTPETPAAS